MSCRATEVAAGRACTVGVGVFEPPALSATNLAALTTPISANKSSSAATITNRTSVTRRLAGGFARSTTGVRTFPSFVTCAGPAGIILQLMSGVSQKPQYVVAAASDASLSCGLPALSGLAGKGLGDGAIRPK